MGSQESEKIIIGYIESRENRVPRIREIGSLQIHKAYLLRSINYSPAPITALNQLIKRIPLNAGSGASSSCSFARNAMFSSLFRPARGLVGSASASVLVGREFSTLGRVLPRPYKLVLQPSCQAHGVRKSCREHINIPSKLQPEIVQTQSWCYKTIAVIKRQQQTTT